MHKGFVVRKRRCGPTSLNCETRQSHGPDLDAISQPSSLANSDGSPSVPSSRRATWLILGRQERLSQEKRRQRDIVLEAHPEVNTACLLAQAFAQVIRTRNAKALEPWLEQAIESGIPELGSFVAGIRRDQSLCLPLSPIRGVKDRWKGKFFA